MKVAFIGLGVMGYPMAGHLARAGHAVTIYNRTDEKARKWVDEFGGVYAPSPAVAAKGAEMVFACVGNDADIWQITMEERGAFSAMAAHSIFVDHTTTSAGVAQKLHVEAQKRALSFLDAPVSGGQSGAQSGKLSVMVGGDEATFLRAKPVIDAYAKTVVRIGASGSGQMTKMVNQICIAGLVQALAEGLFFAKTVGLDTERVLEVISKGAAQSWQMESRSRTMLAAEFDFGFAVDWMRKDLGIVLEQAKSLKIDLPVTQLVDQFYAEIQANGGSRWDTSSLITRLAH